MVYLVSVNADSSTSKVMEWLFKFEKGFLRINNIIDVRKNIDLFPVKIGNSLIYNTLNDGYNKNLSSIWLRKLSSFGNITNPHFRSFYKGESITLATFILQNTADFRKVIGEPTVGIFINKLEVLFIAQKYGLYIPSTIITNSKDDLLKFYNEYRKIIVKPISEAINGTLNGKSILSYTKFVEKKFICNLPNLFPSTLFQQCIEKEYDLRVFYLAGNLYPMVIFSQNDKKTKVDFRKYNFEKPNRTIPYKLPQDVEEKLLRFLREHKFEASSIDMVKCKNTGNYYFLEVNPYGEFGMVSVPCNYYLEKKIAEVL